MSHGLTGSGRRGNRLPFFVLSVLSALSALCALAAIVALMHVPEADAQALKKQAVSAVEKGFIAMNGPEKRIQYLNLGEFVFGGGVDLPFDKGILPGNNVFIPARYLIKSPTGDPVLPYWTVDVYRVAFNPGMRDLWAGAVPGLSAYTDVSFVRVYEVIRIHPVQDPLVGMKGIQKLYGTEGFLKAAFRNATEESLDAMEPGDALVVNRYISTGASAGVMLSAGFGVGPKAAIGAHFTHRAGVTYFKSAPSEVIASWRNANARAAQADLSFRMAIITLPFLADQVRSESMNEKTYVFHLDRASERAMLMDNLAVAEPSVDPELGIRAEIRSSKNRGEYRLASLLGFFSHRTSRESIEIHYENERSGAKHDLFAHARRQRGGAQRSVEAIELDGHRYLRLDVSFEAAAASARDLRDIHARASRLFPKPINVPKLDELAPMSRKLRFDGQLIYSQKAIDDMLAPARSDEDLCSAIETELPPGTPWCELTHRLTNGPAIFEFASKSIHDLGRAQEFRTTLMGLEDLLEAIRGARQKGTLSSMTALLQPNATLAPALRALERFTSESEVYREARLTAEAVDFDALAIARGDYSTSTEELDALVQRTVDTGATFIERAVEPFTFDYFALGGIDRPVRSY